MSVAAIDKRHPLDRRPLMRLLTGIGGTLLTALTLYALVRAVAIGSPAIPYLRHAALIVHLATIVPAIPLGAYLMLRPKGDAVHRTLGKLWLLLMSATAIAAIFIRNINDGRFSWIHLFVVLVLVSVPRAYLAARRGDIAKHRNIVTGLYIYGLLAAGFAAFLPHRTMWWLAFG